MSLGMRGGIAVWFKNMVHEVRPRSANGPVQFGGWFGVQDAWPRRAWAKAAKIDEDVARLQSITTGAMMPRHPSRCPNPFHHMYRYPAHMKSEVGKRPLGHKSVITRTKGDGEQADDVIDTREVPYVMPAFSVQMQKQLGLIPYSAAEMAETDAFLVREVARMEALSVQAGALRAQGVGGAASDSDSDSDGAGAAAWSSSNGRPGRAGGIGGASGAGGVGGAAGAQKRVVPALKRSHKASESATESDSESDDDTQAGPPVKKANVESPWECRKCWHVNHAKAVVCVKCAKLRASS